jgi:thiol-disulfide isomerase/thioredoxin
MSSVQTLSEEYAGQIVFVGMNIGEDPRIVQTFIDERGYNFPIGLDESGSIFFNLYPSPGVPYTVIINGDGVVVDTFSGWARGMHEPFYAAIRNAL